MKQHVTVVAALNIGFGVLKLFAAAIIFVILVGSGFISGEAEALAITSMVGMVIAGFLALTAVPAILGGYGLLRGKAWARILVSILAIFDLIDFPIGTAVAVYTLWVLLHSETSALFEGKSGGKAQLAFG
jgi:hypothetical protein